MFKKFYLIITTSISFILFSNITFAEMNYLKCVEKIDKVRDHFLDEGDTDSLALIEYEGKKNTIKINMVFPNSDEKPFVHIKKSKVENTELGFQIDIAEKHPGLEMREFYDFIKLEDKIVYNRTAYFKADKTNKNEEILLDHDNSSKCENVTKEQYKKLLKQKTWNF
tara:strand:- start:616 stop:1116 length:501 start_codon:yes stop_codon:yes gene_type:complete